MDRRTVVHSGIATCTATILGSFEPRGAHALNLSFYLAGVRFHEIDACNLPHRLDPVVLTREDWHRTPAFSVSTVTGSKLGHVPKAIALRLQERAIAQAHLTEVDVHAVAWKRYTVALRAWAEG